LSLLLEGMFYSPGVCRYRTYICGRRLRRRP
jgi:hypothetical protein